MKNLMQKIQNDCLARDQELVRRLDEVSKQQKLSSQISVLDQQKQILSHFYQNASSYSNLIILGGYAGIFGIWQLTHDYLSPWVILWVALLTSISLFLFVGYEVYKMISNATLFSRLDDVIRKEIPNLGDQVRVWDAAFVERKQQEIKIWRWILVPTILFGFAAGTILLYQFLVNLYQFLPKD